jgi:hypothetical protein
MAVQLNFDKETFTFMGKGLIESSTVTIPPLTRHSLYKPFLAKKNQLLNWNMHPVPDLVPNYFWLFQRKKSAL